MARIVRMATTALAALGLAYALDSSAGAFDVGEDKPVYASEAQVKAAGLENVINGRNVKPESIKHYQTLKAKGVPVEKLRLIRPESIDNIVYHLEKGHYPLDWIMNATTAFEQGVYQFEAVRQDPMY
jgi:hypothetical protein